MHVMIFARVVIFMELMLNVHEVDAFGLNSCPISSMNFSCVVRWGLTLCFRMQLVRHDSLSALNIKFIPMNYGLSSRYICTSFSWFCGFTYIFLCHVKMVQKYREVMLKFGENDVNFFNKTVHKFMLQPLSEGYSYCILLLLAICYFKQQQLAATEGSSQHQ